ncbi:MAG TPA: XRE family transcriptional regulator [Cyanobacteria bacterium UBA11049]|nr:XRE family transcriptional regulator [Cyanobacteria bacterium UBA11049]
MNLKELREKANLRTMDVAVALNVAESSVRNWEHGRSIPSLKLGKPLAKLYKCTLEELCDAITANEGEKEKIGV